MATRPGLKLWALTRMRSSAYAVLVWLVLFSTATAQQPGNTPPPQQPPAQTPAQPDSAYTLKTQANVVLVPATVRTKQGEIIYALRADQFVVEDNGVAQAIHLDEDTDSLGLTLVVLMQCSRAAVMEYAKLSGLATMLDDLAGGAPRQIAIASYGKEPTLLGDFSPDPKATFDALGQLQPCDDAEAATFDAVAWASSLLDEHKDRNRHAILLISETRDHGSHKKPADVIASLGQTNTVVDSVSFSPGKTEVLNDLRFGGGSGPFGLLVMAVNAAKKNAPRTLAELSGGEYINFTTQKGFDNGLHQLSNRIHNYYLLSFQPQAGPNGSPAEGLHSIRVRVPDYPDAKIGSRESYFSGSLDSLPADLR
ncbi:VWA domain-containing protein [Edaphobacter modestus]|uniref:VWFA-related protein n=1 Tax=Edaphobacter modestus TaxID=388466 RepID=A0A4Q7YV33_9BACT|nr:VWA domain-containing protein [Edaphobacter modestus]RZU41194.1 VWFA-related protein [Edaphobacter modestus]